MTDLDQVERDIATLQESIRVATHRLGDPNLPMDDGDRERASIELYQRHLDELLTRRNDLRAMLSD